MMKKLLLTLSAAASFLSGAVQAQTIVPCGTTEMNRQARAQHPEKVAANEADLRKQMAAYIEQVDLSRFAKTTDAIGNTVYHVPIAFHVIHEYGSENISDASIIACVDRVNKYYNKQNADTANIIPAYRGYINNTTTPYIANVKIMWHLATIDPQGKPTNGITRRRNYLTRGAGNQSKFDQWPNTNYMNVWVIAAFPASGSAGQLQAYAYQPPAAATIPFYDGVIALSTAIASGNTLTHELGHTLSLDHTFGATNDPGGAGTTNCNDDDIDDTPPTKGHLTASCDAPAFRDTVLYDTTCLVHYAGIAKIRVDSVKRDTGAAAPIAIINSTSTDDGIVFGCRTQSRLNSVNFYPTAPIGSSYTIVLEKDGAVISTYSLLTTRKDTIQTANVNFLIPGGGKAAVYKLRFSVNPGAWKDSAVAAVSSYSKGIAGSILITEPTTTNRYNFFYNWQMRYGYYKIYSGDSLVDFPDTINAQNIMDYAGCMNMFTNGQAVNMRAALNGTVASRNNLMSESNLRATGVTDASGNFLPLPALAPKAEYSVEQGSGTFVSGARTYFLCAGMTDAKFNFINRSWKGTPTSLSWEVSNGADVPTSTANSVVTNVANPGWVSVKLTATNAQGTDTFVVNPGVYAADPNAIDGVGYFQEFNPGADLDKWPIFNYYNNQFKWEVVNNAGYYDKTSIRYRSYDDRFFPNDITGDPGAGDYDDFFTRALDLSTLGDNGYLNFWMAGSYATGNATLMRDVMQISYSTNCGVSWDTLKSIRNADLQTVGSVTAREYVPGPYTDWSPISIPLKTPAGAKIRANKVFFRFRYTPSSTSRVESGNVVMKAVGNNLYIDRIHVAGFTTSVNEIVLGEKQVGVYPNPTTSNAFVLFKTANAQTNITVTDVTGKVIYSVSQRIDQANTSIEIPANALSVKGLYLVHITGNDGLNHTEKLVVY